ncbi:MAG: hypothetical protein KAQ99_01630 [Candidatus Aureabacteria bacterium]|nr:hypothetical protein [Candidatus Auribacterota bacterium]
MKKIFKRLFILVIIVFIFSITKDLLIKAAIEKGFQSAADTTITIGSLNLNILQSTLTLRNIDIDNPPGFSKVPMLEVSSVRATYVLKGLLDRNIHLKTLKLDIKALNIEQNPDKKMNIVILTKNHEPQKNQPDKKQNPQAVSLKNKKISFLIDEFILSLDEASYSGPYAAGSKIIAKIQLQNKRFTNIKSEKELIDIIMNNSGIAQIRDLFSDEPGSLRKNIEDTIKSIKEAFKK